MIKWRSRSSRRIVPTKRSAIAFARGARRCLEDLDVDGGEHGVEGGGELAVAVADQEPEASVGVVEVHEQVAGLLGQPGSGRVRGDAQDVYPARGVFDDEERVQPVQRDRVEMEQIARDDRLGLRLEELRPGRPATPRRRVDARRVKDLPHGRGADLVAESDELTVHAPIPPGGIFGGQAHGQGADAGGDGWSACQHGRGRPAAAYELTVPAQDRGRCDEESVAAASG